MDAPILCFLSSEASPPWTTRRESDRRRTCGASSRSTPRGCWAPAAAGSYPGDPGPRGNASAWAAVASDVTAGVQAAFAEATAPRVGVEVGEVGRQAYLTHPQQGGMEGVAGQVKKQSVVFFF